ncbi:hypothetical protein H7K05_26190 [Priestia aryabhattai]|uniref:hypothetical protein n=1 Tax=Priestia aryabhattai TaxID=412384 RepID=UPI001C8D0426|nr:hypothetical protein [Priestia aryabhattai]MBY0008800.1 hypothetical protein [Priestia aryabhattai]MBY0049992.1 hypothetical protein [Priestia aryabhattai]
MKKETRLNMRQQGILEEYFDRSVAGDSMETVATEHGISRKTLSQWANTYHGKDLYSEWKTKATQDLKPKYLDVLGVKALTGSIKHMELLAKLMDWFPASKQEIVTEERKQYGYSEPDVDVNDIRKRLKQSNGQITLIK